MRKQNKEEIYEMFLQMFLIISFQSRNEPYAFVEYADHASASAALGALHQRHFLDKVSSSKKFYF